MITEEALPSYQTYFSLIFNEDKEVTSDKGWARWSEHGQLKKTVMVIFLINTCT